MVVFNFSHFGYYVSWCVPPWVYPAWDSLCFLDFADFLLSHDGEVFSFCLFKYFLRFFLSSPSGTPLMQMSVCLMLSQRSLRLSSFLFILFSVFCSVAVISTILSSMSFVHASASVIQLWIPSSILFFSVCLFFSFRRSSVNISCIFSIFASILFLRS